MNIAIYGAGSLGTILGAYITKSGIEIDLISRNKSQGSGRSSVYKFVAYRIFRERP
jgi:ketopantoate reductase